MWDEENLQKLKIAKDNWETGTVEKLWFGLKKGKQSFIPVPTFLWNVFILL